MFTLTKSSTNHQGHKGRWVNAAELRPGMKILLSNNQYASLTESWQPRAQTATTYNFEVANAHTYFVGEQQLWFHNACLTDVWRVDPDNIRILTRVDDDGRKVFDAFEIDDAITDDNLGRMLEVANLEILAKGGTINLKGSEDFIDRVTTMAMTRTNAPAAVDGVEFGDLTRAVLQRKTASQVRMSQGLEGGAPRDSAAVRASKGAFRRLFPDLNIDDFKF